MSWRTGRAPMISSTSAKAARWPRTAPTTSRSTSTVEWEAQAVLEVDHTYNYSGRLTTEWQSSVVSLAGGTSATELTLTEHPPESLRAAAMTGMLALVKSDVAQRVEIQSASITR